MFTLSPKKQARATVEKAMPITALYQSVPVSASINDQGTVITIHTHKIIVEREGKFYQFVSVLESITLIAATMALVSISASSVVFAATMLNL